MLLMGNTAIERGEIRDFTSYGECCYACICIINMEIFSVFLDSHQGLSAFMYLGVSWGKYWICRNDSCWHCDASIKGVSDGIYESFFLFSVVNFTVLFNSPPTKAPKYLTIKWKLPSIYVANTVSTHSERSLSTSRTTKETYKATTSTVYADRRATPSMRRYQAHSL
jgi:hypothetical protein